MTLEPTFEMLVAPLESQLRAHAMRLTRNPEDAKDLVQDAMLKGFSKFHQYKPDTNFKAWMMTILSNTYISGYRKAQRRPVRSAYELEDWQEAEMASHASSGLPDTENEAIENLDDTPAISALRALPENFRTAVYLSDVEGLTYQEVADRMGCPLGTVMSRLFRGRKMIREALSLSSGDDQE